MKLTPQQKLEALALRFYQGQEWTPKAGDLYTTSRADLELYRVVEVREDVIVTEYTEGCADCATWPATEFLTEGFGPNRVWVPDWIITTVAAAVSPEFHPTDEFVARIAQLEQGVESLDEYTRRQLEAAFTPEQK
jgi:hypothetical protein